jgi:hypothetical protein
MIQAHQTSGNQNKVSRLADAWQQLLEETLRRGFHGTASIEIKINDGVVQHIRRKVERMEK